ncbi:MAG: class I SAM-dependent methyltransferase [Bacteroidia bacterium]|nr:class I SAM-dependent methyltransferase [Bacteroidia bacterium]
MEEVKSCPVCASPKQKLFLSCKDFTVSQKVFEIKSCEGCGFKFTSPRPQAQDLGNYYKSEDYVSHSDTKKGAVNRLYHWVRSYTLIKKLQLVLRYSKRGKILDFGCGTGAFLEICKRDKWEVFGIEPDPDARKLAKEKSGVEAFESKEEFHKQLPQQKFDAITLWHVLEHVPDLEAWFEFIKDHISANGKIIIAVPNCSSFDAKKFGEFWAAYDVPRHLSHFTPKDIETLFKKHGYSLIKTLPMVFDSFYVSMLSNKYKHGSTRLFASFWTGFVSNLKANKTGLTFSSQIYILQRA